MLPTPNTLVYLSRVSYFEEKCLVSVEFSNKEKKISHSFKFFPRLFINVSENTEPIIRQLLNSFDRKKFKLEKKSETVLEISARTFSDLKRFCSLLNASLKLLPVLIEPERQFLLSRCWGYFDSFVVSQQGIEKQDSFSLPKIGFDWMNDNLEKEISLLLKKDRAIASRILESIVLSNVVCVPLNKLPAQKSLLAELFLEAASFKNNFAIVKEKKPGFENNKFSFFNGNQDGFAKIDFGRVFAALFGNSFFNLSFETIDCDCCVPETAFEQNILPSSLVEVEFKKNGFFFESKIELFAQRYHESAQGKESRLLRQKEFFLQSLPVGPFDFGAKAIVPIEDALQLQKAGNAIISSSAFDLHWFCKKKEGLLSKELGELNKKIVFVSRALEEKRVNAIKQHGVFSENFLFFDSESFFLQKATEALSSLLESIPVHLLSTNSKFFNKQLSNAFIAIQSIILKDFKQLGASLGAKATVSGNKCLLSTNKALAVSSEFAKKAKLPLPVIN